MKMNDEPSYIQYIYIYTQEGQGSIWSKAHIRN